MSTSAATKLVTVFIVATLTFAHCSPLMATTGKGRAFPKLLHYRLCSARNAGVRTYPRGSLSVPANTALVMHSPSRRGSGNPGQELERTGLISRRRGSLIILDREALDKMSNATYAPAPERTDLRRPHRCNITRAWRLRGADPLFSPRISPGAPRWLSINLVAPCSLYLWSNANQLTSNCDFEILAGLKTAAMHPAIAVGCSAHQ